MTPDDTSKVDSKEQLVAFLDLLLRDHAQNGTTWENPDLSHYIEALQAWLGSSDNYYRNIGEDLSAISPWRRIADAFAAARIYE